MRPRRGLGGLEEGLALIDFTAQARRQLGVDACEHIEGDIGGGLDAHVGSLEDAG